MFVLSLTVSMDIFTSYLMFCKPILEPTEMLKAHCVSSLTCCAVKHDKYNSRILCLPLRHFIETENAASEM